MSMYIKTAKSSNNTNGNPLPFIEAFHNRFKTPEIPSLPRFTGGLVGYFGYEPSTISNILPTA